MHWISQIGSLIIPKASCPYFDLITMEFGEITLSMIIMITTPFVYEYTKNMYIDFVKLHMDIKCLLKRYICSTEMSPFHFFFKKLKNCK